MIMKYMLKVKYPFKDAMETDNLDATLNYAQLYEIILSGK